MPQTTLILSRNLSHPVAAMETPAGFRLELLFGATDQGFAELDQFYRSHGFPTGWTQSMLATGAQAFVVIAPDAAVAAGWITRKPFFVDEIGYTFSPEPQGDYFFGDFVEPAWRGRKLQRLLINRRLQASIAAGQTWAFSMMRLENAASLHSYESQGFGPAARLRSSRLGRLHLDRLRPLDRALVHGSLQSHGFSLGLPFSLRLCRQPSHGS